MQKTYFVGQKLERLPLLIRSVSENSQQADISATTILSTLSRHTTAEISILSMIVIKFEFDKQPFILLQTRFMRCFVLFSSVTVCRPAWPHSHDFYGRLSASRNFHGTARLQLR